MNDSHVFKSLVHRQCLTQVQLRLSAISANIEELRASAQEHGKSSAGDKHETSRAMADLEIEKQTAALHNLRQMQAVLKQLDPKRTTEKAVAGALVHTAQGMFYIAVPLGKIKAGEHEVLVISPGAPVVKTFSRFPHEKNVHFNGKSYEIKEIF